jgi:hypothetical protein
MPTPAGVEAGSPRPHRLLDDSEGRDEGVILLLGLEEGLGAGENRSIDEAGVVLGLGAIGLQGEAVEGLLLLRESPEKVEAGRLGVDIRAGGHQLLVMNHGEVGEGGIVGHTRRTMANFAPLSNTFLSFFILPPQRQPLHTYAGSPPDKR